MQRRGENAIRNSPLFFQISLGNLASMIIEQLLLPTGLMVGVVEQVMVATNSTVHLYVDVCLCRHFLACMFIIIEPVASVFPFHGNFMKLIYNLLSA